MPKSLLAHLYMHIRGSQEDIATISLQYIISQWSDLKDEFNTIIGNKLHVDLTDVLNYTCQATGEGLERPDLSGTNKYGEEVVLCEAKFYAGLTSNQPISYLERLYEENGKGLIFICPEKRITGLWNKLLYLCNGKKVEEIDNSCVRVDEIPMAIITWHEIIENLRRRAISDVPSAISDIDQLEGYCAEMDLSAFIPFSTEELGAATAQKQQRFYQVIDKLSDLLLTESNRKASKVGKATPYIGGYERKVALDSYEINFTYDERMWLSTNSKETPFWLAIKDKDKNQNKDIMNYYNTLPSTEIEDLWTLTYIALDVLTEATLDEIAMDLKKQILNHIDAVQEMK